MLNAVAPHASTTLGKAKQLRRAQTNAEWILWRKLRAKRFHGLKFRRQVPLGKYIVDFLCVDQKLIIEIDGDVHVLKQKRDAVRQRFLEDKGFRFVRFTNEQVKQSMSYVLLQILQNLSTPLPYPLPTGEGDLPL